MPFMTQLGRGLMLFLVGCQTIIGAETKPPQATPATSSPISKPPVLTQLNYRDERFSLNGDPVRLYKPQSPGPYKGAIIFHHGFGMDENQIFDQTRFASQAAMDGYIVASAGFGGKSHWGNQRSVELTQALINELTLHHKVKSQDIFLMGFSMGGHAVLNAVGQKKLKPKAIALLAAITDLDLFYNLPSSSETYRPTIDLYYKNAFERKQASGVSHLDELKDIPIYLAHGERDTIVPKTQADVFLARYTSQTTRQKVSFFPYLEHDETIIQPAEILKFFADVTNNIPNN
jgi:predicted esterase